MTGSEIKIELIQIFFVLVNETKVVKLKIISKFMEFRNKIISKFEEFWKKVNFEINFISKLYEFWKVGNFEYYLIYGNWIEILKDYDISLRKILKYLRKF